MRGAEDPTEGRLMAEPRRSRAGNVVAVVAFLAVALAAAAAGQDPPHWASVALDIDAQCSGGKVRTEMPIAVEGALDRGQIRGTLNGGGATLRLRGSGGGIRIQPL